MFHEGDMLQVTIEFRASWPGKYMFLGYSDPDRPYVGVIVEPIGNARRPTGNIFRTECVELVVSLKRYLETGEGNEQELFKQLCGGT